MEWTADAKKEAYRLVDDGLDLARIYLTEKPKRKNPWQVKVLVSFLYFGRSTQGKLERSNKEWKVKKRTFGDREQALSYISIKQEEILRFVRSRESA